MSYGSELQMQLAQFEFERAQTHDYFAVYLPPKLKTKRARERGLWYHLCTVFARDSKHALQIARNHGLTLRKGASASRIGRHGYAAQFGSMTR